MRQWLDDSDITLSYTNSYLHFQTVLSSPQLQGGKVLKRTLKRVPGSCGVRLRTVFECAIKAKLLEGSGLENFSYCYLCLLQLLK